MTEEQRQHLSKANELLQELNQELTNLWTGKTTKFKNCKIAFDICREIVKEAEKAGM